MTPKPLFRRAQQQHQVFPHLHLLRLLLGTILLFSVLPPPNSVTLSTLLRDLSPSLLPFLIFLSAFTLTYSPRPLLHRVLALLPLHLFTTLIHLPNPQAFTDAFLLSPFLPLYSLPPTSPPTPAPTLLPSLILLSFLHPSLTSLLPRPSNPRHITFILLLSWLATLLQAVWLTHLPNTPSNPRSIMLFDIAAYFPCLIHLPAYIAGILLANLRHATPPTIHPILPALLLLTPLRIFLSDIPITLRTWLSTGALLPPFALLVYSLTRLTVPPATIIPYTRVSLTTFALAVPVYSFLSRFCNHRNNFCLPVLHSPPPHQYPPSQLQAAAYRLLHPITLPTPAVRLTIYLPILILTSLIIHIALIHPLTTFLQTIAQRATPSAYPSPQLQPIPKRSVTRLERLARLCAYYAACISFIAVVFRFSLPLTRQLASQRSPSLLCYLPRFLYKCDLDVHQSSALQGMLAKFGLGSEFLTAFADAFRWVSLLTLPTMVFNLVGHIIFPRAVWRRLPSVREMLNDPVGDDVSCKFVIYFRYVTRGNNSRLVANNARRAAEVLSESGLPKHRWRVEVVTDRSLNLHNVVAHEEVYEILVPKEYRAANGAKYKARALNYAIGASPAREEDWIVHLDEETKFDVDTVRGILHHCSTEAYETNVVKRQEWPRIGQGPIVYGRALMDEDGAGADNGNWLTTLADSGRVSDDCGRYRMQYECGEVWVGMHGSFVVACNRVEQAVTFDHGVDGSIAEDAFFAMIARSKNVRFAWIDALMYEQSPFTVMDFVKQRARWLVGGLLVVWSSKIPWVLRSFMGVLTGLWALMPVMYTGLIVGLLFGSGDSTNRMNHLYYHVLLPSLAAMSMWNYVFGFFVTFSLRRLGVVKFLVTLYAQLALTPIFGVMEVGAVCYALWKFKKLSVGFHVVEKDGVVDNGRTELRSNKMGDHHQVDEQTNLV